MEQQSALTLWQRTKGLLGLRGVEGSRRGPFSGMGELGGWYSIDPAGDGWQRNLEVSAKDARHVPAVYACVMLISRAIAQCYPRHVRDNDGQFKDIRTSAAFRVLKNPNEYQATPDFILNLIATALFEGEAFAVTTRNDRNEIDSLHMLQPGSCTPLIDDESRSIFYAVGTNPLDPNGTDYILPARDVLHLRFHTPRHPLVGETPIKAAALAININVSLSKSQAAFFKHMSRPSGVLTFDSGNPERPFLDKTQMESLRAAWENASQHLNQGRVPILGANMKFQPMSVTSQDAQLVQAQRMSLEDICRVFGVPGPLVGDLSHATLNNSETLMRSFLAMSLGSYIEHVERQFDRLFGLGNNEYVELDTAALLRTDFTGRVEGLTKAIQGGLMTPTEARGREGLGPIKGGETAYLQRQMVPIDKIGDLLANEGSEPDVEAPPPAMSIEEGKSFDAVYANLLVADTIKKGLAA